MTRITIPAGPAWLGNDAVPDEAPLRKVDLPQYQVTRTEVTLAQYDAFVDAGGYRDPALWTEDGLAWLEDHPDASSNDRALGREPNHPVFLVTRWEAEAFCAWAGGRLPTEWEWERAARGPEATKYSWGDQPKDHFGNWYSAGKYAFLTGYMTWEVEQSRPETRTREDGVNFAGNVWEWTSSTYHHDATGGGDSPWTTIRGGSWINLPSYCTATHREPALADEPRETLGIRCAF